MSTERKIPGKRIWFYPLLLAIPLLAAVVFAVFRFGPKILQLISAAVKMVVVS